MDTVGGASVTVIGAGYVGLTTAVCMAGMGHRVRCADSDTQKVAILSSGQSPIVEVGLGERLKAALAAGRLRFETDAINAAAASEFVFLCLPTPQGRDGAADITVLYEVVRSVGPHLRHNATLVTKSTVPVGSATAIRSIIARADIAVVANPEFLREGTAINDCLHPDRVVIGTDDPEAGTRVASLFASTHAPVLITDPVTAETIKYASNAFLATKLSFVNAVATLCDRIDADVRDVILGMAYDHRIGFDYVTPGPGWGGSCLPKDTNALLHIAAAAGHEFSLLRGAIETNEAQLHSIVAKAQAALKSGPADPTVAVWGLTFKAGTDDRRESPALEIVARLAQLGSNLQLYDPTVRCLPELDAPHRICTDLYQACSGADLLLLLTEWDEFQRADFQRVAKVMSQPNIVDARNLLDPDRLRMLGFHYVGVGRK